MPLPLFRLPTALVSAAALVLSLAPAPARAQLRMQVIPFESVTLTTQQVLLGETNGKPVTIAGELRLPRGGSDKLPVVILVHGLGGMTMNHDEWARVLNGWGIGVFIPDHLSGRGIAPMSPDDLRLSAPARTVDVYRALSVLSKHPRIDPDRIALMGTSMGGAVALFSSQDRFRRIYGPAGVQFAAYIGLYASCSVRYRDDVKVAARPIRLFHGTGDDWTSVEQCRALVADLKKAGADVRLTEFPGAMHAYDMAGSTERVKFPQAMSFRKCSLAEGAAGQVVNTKSGQPFTPGDPCVERGTSVAYDAEATAATREALKAALASAFAG